MFPDLTVNVATVKEAEEFYDIDIIYGNVDINKFSDIKLNVYLKLF